MRIRRDELIAAACFSIAGAIGLIGAFVGLEASSFWTDELFTAWVVGADNNISHMLGRAVTDVHPPVYYGLIFLFAQVAGHSDAALRLFSALCACGAIIVFVAATRRTFSLPGRLFAAAMATGSIFWFDQSQNARDYSLCLLIGGGLLALSLRVLADRRAGLPALSAIFALTFVGSFVHFYLLFECLALLMVLALYLPKRRLSFAAMFVFLFVSSELYSKLIIQRQTMYSLSSSWIANSPAWNLLVLRYTVHSTVDALGLVALAICAVAAILRLRDRRAPDPATLAGAPPTSSKRWMAVLYADPVWVLCLGVPTLVVAAGVSTSALLSPNLTDRNVLICSPFIWGLFAKSYDAAVPGLSRLFRWPANGALGAILLVMSTIVAGRALPQNEPYRESAAWIRTLPGCAGQEIPVVDTDDKAWANSAWTQLVVSSEYGRYLGGFARPRVVYLGDLAAGALPPDVRAELHDRMGGQGCAVVGWDARGMTPDRLNAVVGELTAAAGANAASRTIRVKSFEIYDLGLVQYFQAPGGYAFYVDDGSHR